MRAALSSADLALAHRMETAEAASLTRMAHALQSGSTGCEMQAIGGGVAIFAGTDSPLTHATGIGMNGAVMREEMEALEQFYGDRGSPCAIDLCPLAHPSVVAFVQSQPYQVVEFNNILARHIEPDENFVQQPEVRPVDRTDLQTWARLVSEGFAEYMPVTDDMVNLLATTCQGSQCWMAGPLHEPLAGGAMAVENQVALFYGDATLLRGRRAGLQTRLIAHRLAAARDSGCNLAMTSVLPGSASHRNYQRAGFELAYMRLSLRRIVTSR